MDDLREVIARAIEPLQHRENYGFLMDRTDAALAAIKQAGFVVVPAEPAEAMISAGEQFDSEMGCTGNPEKIYRAMIEASNAP